MQVISYSRVLFSTYRIYGLEITISKKVLPLITLRNPIYLMNRHSKFIAFAAKRTKLWALSHPYSILKGHIFKVSRTFLFFLCNQGIWVVFIKYFVCWYCSTISVRANFSLGQRLFIFLCTMHKLEIKSSFLSTNNSTSMPFSVGVIQFPRG